jgi:hypothetical protein
MIKRTAAGSTYAPIAGDNDRFLLMFLIRVVRAHDIFRTQNRG